jgi:hypothetical protein
MVCADHQNIRRRLKMLGTAMVAFVRVGRFELGRSAGRIGRLAGADELERRAFF